MKNQTQWTKLSGKNSQHVAICQKWPFPDFLESGIWKFQKIENSNNLREKTSLGTHTEWEKYVICCNLSKTAISKGFPDFLESGIWKSGNSGSHQKCPKLTYKWRWLSFFKLFLQKAHFGTFSLFWAKLVVDFSWEKQQIPFEHRFLPRIIFFHKSKVDGLQKLDE